MMTAATAALAVPGLSAQAQAPARRRIRFTAVFSDQDIRAEAMRGFQTDLQAQFDVELHATLAGRPVTSATVASHCRQPLTLAAGCGS